MAYFIQLAFAGLAQGCIYALVALGFTIIFKSSGVINFAQGELLLVGAFVASVAAFEWGLNFFLAVFIALLITVLIGVLFERFALRRMIGRPAFSIIMITIGLDILLRTGVVMTGISNERPPAAPYGIASGVNYGGVHFGENALWIIAVTLVCCVALYVFFRHTRYGLAMRATALDQEAALAMGVNIRLVNALAWGIAAAVAAIAGVFLAINVTTFDSTLGSIALFAFPAIILGGLDSIPGAVVGGVIIGLVQLLTQGYESHITHIVGTGFDTITPYLLMLIILLVRPYGLFGTRKVERV
ncbi:MAG TPA: branched-chain amino acid ABC transporter permease [Ktedonobacterales bacterium]|nr:branched-chain amino acid ABC transporter permease [Ktedonobacterales bacterium]